jgi:hypothetical protein
LELNLEARDYNPDLTGIGLSEIVRIEVITEAEYAEMIRARETLDQLTARYRAVQEQLETFREIVEALRQELAKEQPDREGLNQLLDRARAQNREAREFFAQLAEEFPAYALEAGWQQALREIASRLEGHGDLLQGMTADVPGLSAAIERLQLELKRDLEQVARQLEQTQDFTRIGRVLEHISWFRQLLERQRQLARALQRYESSSATPGELAYHADQQAAIRRDLIEFAASLAAAADQLPADEDLNTLRQSAREFVQKLNACGAGEAMEQATGAARNQDGAGAARAARLARERLEELLAECAGSPFGRMCQGNELSFNVKEELRESLEQLLASLLGGGRRGIGVGLAEGGGLGDGGDGFSVPALTRLNTPVFGPERRMYVPGGQARGRGGQGGQRGSVIVQQERRESLGGVASKAPGGKSHSPEMAPERYREALKRYFSEPENSR